MSGTVRDEDGAPVPRAVVEITPEGSRRAVRVRSDDLGWFVAAGLPRGVDLRVVASRHRAVFPRHELPTVRADVTPPLVLTLGGTAPVSGRVIDEHGAAIGGAWLRATPERSRREFRRATGVPTAAHRAQTASDGTFRFDLPRGLMYDITPERDKARRARLVGVNRVYAGTTDLRLQALPGDRLTGVVVNASGDPVPDLTVTLREGDSVRTGSDGAFAFHSTDRRLEEAVLHVTGSGSRGTRTRVRFGGQRLQAASVRLVADPALRIAGAFRWEQPPAVIVLTAWGVLIESDVATDGTFEVTLLDPRVTYDVSAFHEASGRKRKLGRAQAGDVDLVFAEK